MHAHFDIPPEYQPKLRPVQPKDTRSDDEILDSLTQPTPVSSEKNIWAFWHAGLRGLPNWCPRNLIDWHRVCGPSWTVRLLDTVPGSPNNALQWVDADMLPEAFVKGTMEGPYVGQHSADLLRAATLWEHGGVWMDVGIILIRDLDRVCWDQLADESNPYEMCNAYVDGVIIANHFVAGRKGSEFLRKRQELFSHLWSDRNSSTGLISNPLLAFRGEMLPSAAMARYNFPMKLDKMPTIMDYTAQISAYARLAVLEEPSGGFNGQEYRKNKILKFDALGECWAAEAAIGFGGQDLFDLLATKRTGPDAQPQSEEYQLAEKVVWRLLSSASMQKVTHGHDLVQSLGLGNNEPGTFADLLRCGSVRFEQTREEIECVDPENVEVVMRKGLLEP
ncbi:hypothetical protein M409DRAFT_69071 [Zasmidium cellare ATCC 36951]|uniref:Glycosyltransferase family 32 protein n=1 Tax=Zasmidium cellare ATCC 36951 TaxID=1080233 RepID=A0A6A6CAI8_ZASCE|nr:uncharacterized protein M409DRAFT_69071 [Zasmidium cellare ATCC 36951]KAF2162466.1 hypothetical protein M409DRAFT_69071 [Zasmidium cellare ATCC 36951]